MISAFISIILIVFAKQVSCLYWHFKHKIVQIWPKGRGLIFLKSFCILFLFIRVTFHIKDQKIPSNQVLSSIHHSMAQLKITGRNRLSFIAGCFLSCWCPLFCWEVWLSIRISKKGQKSTLSSVFSGYFWDRNTHQMESLLFMISNFRFFYLINH